MGLKSKMFGYIIVTNLGGNMVNCHSNGLVNIIYLHAKYYFYSYFGVIWCVVATFILHES